MQHAELFGPAIGVSTGRSNPGLAENATLGVHVERPKIECVENRSNQFVHGGTVARAVGEGERLEIVGDITDRIRVERDVLNVDVAGHRVSMACPPRAKRGTRFSIIWCYS